MTNGLAAQLTELLDEMVAADCFHHGSNFDLRGRLLVASLALAGVQVAASPAPPDDDAVASEDVARLAVALQSQLEDCRAELGRTREQNGRLRVTSKLERAQRAEAQVAELREALEPFTRITHRSQVQMMAFLTDEHFERAREVWAAGLPEKGYDA